jgi:hypothetical protein
VSFKWRNGEMDLDFDSGWFNGIFKEQNIKMTNFSLKTRIYSGGLMLFYDILSLFIKPKNQIIKNQKQSINQKN